MRQLVGWRGSKTLVFLAREVANYAFWRTENYAEVMQNFAIYANIMRFFWRGYRRYWNKNLDPMVEENESFDAQLTACTQNETHDSNSGSNSNNSVVGLKSAPNRASKKTTIKI